jgi:hypothetical protein
MERYRVIFPGMSPEASPAEKDMSFVRNIGSLFTPIHHHDLFLVFFKFELVAATASHINPVYPVFPILL